MFKKSFYLQIALLFAATASNQCLQAETFNGPTALHDKDFDELVINGPADLKNIRANSLKVKGPLRFYRIDILGATEIEGAAKGQMARFQDMTISGPFKAQKVSFASLNASGPVSLNKFTVIGSTKIQGPLTAENGSFQDLTAGAESGEESVSLENITVKNVYINKGKKEPVLRLSGDTYVGGKVTFDSGKGKIEKVGDNVRVGPASSKATK